MAYASWSVVFGEQPSAAKWNILGTNDSYFDGLIGSGTAWTSYIPTFTTITVGSGAVVGAYQQFGKTVHFRFSWTFGTGSSVGTGNPTVTLPVTAATYASDWPINGQFMALDSGNNVYSFTGLWSSTTLLVIRPILTSGTYATSGGGVTSTTPFTWGTGDKLFGSGSYEAA